MFPPGKTCQTSEQRGDSECPGKVHESQSLCDVSTLMHEGLWGMYQGGGWGRYLFTQVQAGMDGFKNLCSVFSRT